MKLHKRATTSFQDKRAASVSVIQNEVFVNQLSRKFRHR
jgi:hypothetical protein